MVLERLGLYGLHSIENAILAALVTGDPALLVGTHGSGKTLLCNRLAEALDLKFHAYDASKSLFEDVLGFPNPRKLAEADVVDYVSTPISIWDKEFILIDEVSRASPQLQSKWLEIIRSRKVMGKKIPHLRYIFGAMNPLNYKGAIPLDQALAGRFAFIIPMPEVSEMKRPDIMKIIRHLSEDDAPLVQKGRFRLSDEDKTFIKNLLNSIQQEYNKLMENQEIISYVENYIIGLETSLKVHQKALDGRRLGMLRRNLLAYLAVEKVKNKAEEFLPQPLFNVFYDCLLFSIPFQITEEDITKEMIFAAHTTTIKMLKEKIDLDIYCHIFSIQDIYQSISNYLANWDKFSEIDHQNIITYLEEYFDKTEDEDNDAKIAQRFLIFQRLVEAEQREQIKLPVSVAKRIYSLYLRPLQNLSKSESVRGFIKFISYYNEKNPWANIKLTDEIDVLSVKLTICKMESEHRYHLSRYHLDEEWEKASSVFDAIRTTLKNFSEVQQ